MPYVPSDEGRHDGAQGVEAWDLAFGAGATTGRVLLTLDVAHRRAGVVVDLVVPEIGRVVVADESVPVPRAAAGLEVRTDGLWASWWCETAFEHWSLGLEAFGLRVDPGADVAAASWEDLVGERVPVGYDLEWELRGPPDPLPDGSGYSQPGTVFGELLVARDRIEVDEPATRAHWWGGEPGRLAP